MSQKQYRTNCKAAQDVSRKINILVQQELQRVDPKHILTATVDVAVIARFPFWPTDLAKLLCDDPNHAKLPNKELVKLITDADGETGLGATRLSEKLSEKAKTHVKQVLRNYGYATDTLTYGTDIKRIVKNNIRIETQKKEVINFFYDSLEFNGTRYSYKFRRRVTGDRLKDIRIRMDGSDIPLSAVLKFTRIKTNHFRKMDKLACEFASCQHTVPTASNLRNKVTTHVLDGTQNPVQVTITGFTEIPLTDPADLPIFTIRSNAAANGLSFH